jgi:hypothetical protein
VVDEEFALSVIKLEEASILFGYSFVVFSIDGQISSKENLHVTHGVGHRELSLHGFQIEGKILVNSESHVYFERRSVIKSKGLISTDSDAHGEFHGPDKEAVCLLFSAVVGFDSQGHHHWSSSVHHDVLGLGVDSHEITSVWLSISQANNPEVGGLAKITVPYEVLDVLSIGNDHLSCNSRVVLPNAIGVSDAEGSIFQLKSIFVTNRHLKAKRRDHTTKCDGIQVELSMCDWSQFVDNQLGFECCLLNLFNHSLDTVFACIYDSSNAVSSLFSNRFEWLICCGESLDGTQLTLGLSEVTCENIFFDEDQASVLCGRSKELFEHHFDRCLVHDYFLSSTNLYSCRSISEDRVL